MLYILIKNAHHTILVLNTTVGPYIGHYIALAIIPSWGEYPQVIRKIPRMVKQMTETVRKDHGFSRRDG